MSSCCDRPAAQLVEIGEKLIRSGVLYCDNTPVDQMRDERIKCIESKCRNRSVEENLRVWEEMKKGSEEGQQNAVRFKLNMKVRPLDEWTVWVTMLGVVLKFPDC